MDEVASRELRNNTAGVIRRVQEGETVAVTVNGRRVAQLTPIQDRRRRWIGRNDLLERLHSAMADPGLRLDLARLAGDTTDDLDVPR